MLAIVSLINPQSARRINGHIADLEKLFGLDAVQATPDPHLTYLLADVRDAARLEKALADVAATTPPFPAYTTGLGMFPGDNPVIYVPVLRSNDLNFLHQRVLDVTKPLARGTDKFNTPALWLPHLSLALHDTTPELLGPVLRHLNHQTYNMRLTLNNLAIMEQDGEKFRVRSKFKLCGRK